MHGADALGPQPDLGGGLLAGDDQRPAAAGRERGARPRAAASTCRPRARRPAARPSRGPGRRRARGRARRRRWACASLVGESSAIGWAARVTGPAATARRGPAPTSVDRAPRLAFGAPADPAQRRRRRTRSSDRRVWRRAPCWSGHAATLSGGGRQNVRRAEGDGLRLRPGDCSSPGPSSRSALTELHRDRERRRPARKVKVIVTVDSPGCSGAGRSGPAAPATGPEGRRPGGPCTPSRSDRPAAIGCGCRGRRQRLRGGDRGGGARSGRTGARGFVGRVYVGSASHGRRRARTRKLVEVSRQVPPALTITRRAGRRSRCPHETSNGECRATPARWMRADRARACRRGRASRRRSRPADRPRTQRSAGDAQAASAARNAHTATRYHAASRPTAAARSALPRLPIRARRAAPGGRPETLTPHGQYRTHDRFDALCCVLPWR